MYTIRFPSGLNDGIWFALLPGPTVSRCAGSLAKGATA
jgi:hypothetical protein